MHRNLHSRIAAFFSLSLLLISCGTSTSTPTQTPTLPQAPTPVPPTETAILPTDLPVLSEDEGPIPTPIPVSERAKYTINATLDYAAKTVSVDQTILYPNHSGETLSDLVLAVVPNMWPGSFNLAALGVDGTPITREILKKDVLVFDTVYNPLKTRLIREAEERGCPTVVGLTMFVNQAALQFELWTGQKPPIDLMKEAAARELACI